MTDSPARSIKARLRKLMVSPRLYKLLGLAVFAVLLAKVNLDELWRIFSGIEPFALATVFVIVAVVLCLKTMRWKFILDQQGIPVSLVDAGQYYLASVYLGMMTPGRVGEIGRVFFVRDRASYAKLLVGVLLERGVDLALLGVIACVGLLFFPLWGMALSWWITGCACACILLAVVGIRQRGDRVLAGISNRFFAGLMAGWQEFRDELTRLSGRAYAFFVVLSVAGWLLQFFAIFILTRSMNMGLTYPQVVFFAALGSLVAIIPVSYAGIGIRDALLIVLFSRIGLDRVQAIAFSSLFLLLYFMIMLVCAISWYAGGGPLRKTGGEKESCQ